MSNTTWAGTYIREHDLGAAIDAIEESFDLLSATATRVKALSIRCETCDGTGETPTGYVMGGWNARGASGACRTCHGRGVYALLTIDGERYRASLMDAYCLIEHGTAELDVAASTRELELIAG
jgi:hypothetical protein